jgi:tRNA threonylcarbamoyladenosine biosynthesis protein TsaB
MILALQTADATTRLWLFDPKATPVEPTEIWESGRQLADGLLSHIVALLAAQKHQLTDLTGVIIFSGPGSFTSLRIGHAVANALADSLAIPIVGRQGDDWLVAGHHALEYTQPHQPVLPHYGSEANVTRSRG